MSVITQLWGYSALMWAAMLGNTEVVVELVKAGANVNMQDDVCQYRYMHMMIYMYIVHVCMKTCN